MKIKRKTDHEGELDPWLDEEYLKVEPIRMPEKMSKAELNQRLHGGVDLGGGKVTEGIVGYNRTKIKEGMVNKCTTERELKVALARAGYDWRLAVGVGISGSSYEDLEQYMENTRGSLEFKRTRNSDFQINTGDDIPD